VAQLRQVETLEGAILPDGMPLPTRTKDERIINLPETWHETFEAWCETVETEEYGFIKPAKLPPADPDADE